LENRSFQNHSQDEKLQGVWQTEIQVQLHCVHKQEIGEEWLALKDNAGTDDPQGP
jgi:hypothetical protein